MIRVACEDHGPMQRDEAHKWWKRTDPGCDAWITDEDIARQRRKPRGITVENG